MDFTITVPTGCNLITVGVGFSNQWGACDTVKILGSAGMGTRITNVGVGGGASTLDVWKITGAIPTGTQTIHCKWGSVGATVAAAEALTFVSTNASTPTKSSASGTGSPSSVSTAVTCNTGDIMVAFSYVANRTLTGTGGTTLLAPRYSSDSYSYLNALYEVAGASDKTISYSLSSANPEVHITFAVQP